MKDLISLRDLPPLAYGTSRCVYRHPSQEGHLIKIIRPEVVEARFGKGAKWYKRRRRYGKYLSFHREIQEYLVAYQDLGFCPPFLVELLGFAKTDLGLGLVIQGIFNQNGDLAPNLRTLVKDNRYTPKVAQALEQCFQELLASRIIISDLNIGNFVYQEEKHRFIMVDGSGNTNPLGLKALSGRMNARSKLRRFERLRQRIARYQKDCQPDA